MNLFGAFDLKPFWKDHYLKEDYVGMKLILGILGYTVSLWLVLITIVSRMSRNLLSTLDVEINFIVNLFESWSFNLIIGTLISIGLTAYQLRTHEVFDGYEVVDNFEEMRIQILQSLENTQNTIENDSGISTGTNIKFISIVLAQILNGFITGILFSVIYFLPYFVIVFMLIFLIGTLLPAGLFLVYSSIVISWALTYLYAMRRRIDFKIPDQKKPKMDVYPLKRRDIEILRSDEPPIVCDYCRSFIPATSSSCPVCESPINTDQEN